MERKRPNQAPKISARESQVLKLLADGFTNQEVAEHLSLSQRTVEAHRARLMLKLSIHDIAGLVKYAVRQGLTNLEDHRSL